MNLHLFDIPDDPAALPGWLERYLLGPQLAALVAELDVLAPVASAQTLDAALGDHADAVLRRGLRVLPQDHLHALLRQPRLLLDLQEEVLLHGGAYWLEQVQAAPVEREVRADWRRLERATHSRRPKPRWDRRPWLLALASAAAVLLLAYGLDRSTPIHDWLHPKPHVAPTRWGWARPGALPKDVTPAAYLHRLADLATEWFDREPADAVALARRLTELRQGCAVLILAAHEPLAAADRIWLTERCRAWAEQFDNQMRRLEEGGDAGGVRQEMNGTVRRLIEGLRERARAGAKVQST